MSYFQDYICDDLPIKKELLKIFDKNESIVIFDIGACECEDSIRYSKLFKKSTIYAFEPLPKNFIKCLRNTALFSNQNIKPFQIALSKENGIAEFYVSSVNQKEIVKHGHDIGNKSSSLYPPNLEYKKMEWLIFKEQIKVETKTIDFFCKENSIDKIDFIHMDVQGSELDVLLGAKHQLNKVTAIWLEVVNVSQYVGQPLKKEIEDFMKKSNFIKLKDRVFGDSGDQLYVNSSNFHRHRYFLIKTKLFSYLKVANYKLIQLKKSLHAEINEDSYFYFWGISLFGVFRSQK